MDEHDFQKKLAKVQIQATLLAVILSTILALGIALLSFSLTLQVQQGSELVRDSGVAVIFIAIGIALYLLRAYYRDVDRSDKDTNPK